MFEKFMSNGAGDYRQRYEGTYGFFTSDSKQRILVKLAHIITDADRPYVDFVDSAGVGFRLYADSDRGFEFIPPKSEWYNTTQGATYVTRQATRQWVRGVHSRNTNIYTLIKGTATPQPVDFPILSEIYMPVNPITLQRAEKSLASYAISPQMALDFRLGNIHLLGEQIGKFSKHEDLFRVELSDKDLWITEVSDAFRRKEQLMELV